MNVLIEVLGGDDDSNVADTLSAHKIKDPSLIISKSPWTVTARGLDQRVEARNDSMIAHVITLLCCRINRDPVIMEDRQLI